VGAQVQIGQLAFIEIYGNRVVGMASMVSEGLQRRIIESSEFGDDIDFYEFGPAKQGSIFIRGFASPDDSNGQEVLATACENGMVFNEGDLRLYISPSNYFTIESPGTMGIISCKNFRADRRGLAQTDFGIAFSGGPVARMTQNSIVWDVGFAWNSGIAWDSNNFVPAI